MAAVSNFRSYLVRVVLGFALAAALFRLQGPLKTHLEKLSIENKLNRELTQHKDEYLSSYQRILSTQKLPTTRLLNSNEWIQLVQTLVSDEQLLLQELKPVRDGKIAGGRGGSLYLVVEGQPIKVLNFFYRIFTANDLIYVRGFNLSSTDEDSDLIRAQLTLSQF